MKILNLLRRRFRRRPVVVAPRSLVTQADREDLARRVRAGHEYMRRYYAWMQQPRGDYLAGGVIRPGVSLAYNDTGKPERIFPDADQ